MSTWVVPGISGGDGLVVAAVVVEGVGVVVDGDGVVDGVDVDVDVLGIDAGFACVAGIEDVAVDAVVEAVEPAVAVTPAVAAPPADAAAACCAATTCD